MQSSKETGIQRTHRIRAPAHLPAHDGTHKAPQWRSRNESSLCQCLGRLPSQPCCARRLPASADSARLWVSGCHLAAAAPPEERIQKVPSLPEHKSGICADECGG
jgi:hypothetical protein